MCYLLSGPACLKSSLHRFLTLLLLNLLVGRKENYFNSENNSKCYCILNFYTVTGAIVRIGEDLLDAIV